MNLQRLYIERNMIRKLEGLQNCTKLEELTMQEQRLPRNVVFEFDEYSLAAIANTLYNLNLASNQIVNCKQLYFCDRLETLNLRGNWINDFQDQVMPLLTTMRGLTHLDLRDNDVQKISKYRE